MIQVQSGQTVYQALSKIFIRKNVPWFKCGKLTLKLTFFSIFFYCEFILKDLYYVGDYQVTFKFNY